MLSVLNAGVMKCVGESGIISFAVKKKTQSGWIMTATCCGEHGIGIRRAHKLATL